MQTTAAIQWNDDLVERYNVSGPRYTSYPTALQFHSGIGADRYRDWLLSLPQSKPLSLYIHIPFCWHVCYYCACNKIVTRDYERVGRYLNALEKEMSLIAGVLKGQKVKQIHWGGGTPTFLNSTDRKRLVEMIYHYFSVEQEPNLDFSIEVDPRTISAKDIKELREFGFNRISLGIQDFNLKVQQSVNRLQSLEDTQALVDEARKQEFRSINLDLIYGLPNQSVASFKQTLRDVIDLRPDRLSVFNYAHLPHRFKAQRRIESGALPSSSIKLSILKLTTEMMQEAGYRYIGMDHFALPDDELSVAQRNGQLHRSFQGYTTHKECEVIGLGVSSIGTVGSHYAQNHSDLSNYYLALSKNELPVWRGVESDEGDRIRKAVIFEIICNFKLSFAQIERQFNICFVDYFRASIASLKQMAHDGLLELSEDGFKVTDSGRLLVRNICMAFDNYLFAHQAQNSFSKAI